MIAFAAKNALGEIGADPGEGAVFRRGLRSCCAAAEPRRRLPARPRRSRFARAPLNAWVWASGARTTTGLDLAATSVDLGFAGGFCWWGRDP